MEIQKKPAQTFIGIMNALELYKQERFDGWAIGALDSLFFMRATLFPLNPEEEIEGIDAPLIEALHALNEERKERFEQKVRKNIKQDEMLIKMYSQLFEEPTEEEETEPEHSLLLNLCDALELYLQRRRNLWVIGALDALRWVKVTLFPFEPKPTDNEMYALTYKALQRVHKEWQEQFENELRKRFKNDEMLRRICKELF